ncbi:hypothetical protein OF83DRAFT_1171137 [Amylostereum chailletii]|nr:hypothetical protein OF83DRAFT_1171137 [Amylostereum chailletii]
MSAGNPEKQISYIDRGVQTTPPPKSPTCSLSSSDSPFNDAYVSVLLSSPTSGEDLLSDAYTHAPSQSSPRPAPLKVQRNTKPRLPSSNPSEISLSNRIVSMPETTPVFSIKAELSQTLRVVSMPEKRPTGGYGTDSSMSSDGVNTSLTASSFASVSEASSGISFPPQHGQTFLHTPSPPSTPDSVLIIENNGELGDGFLHCESIVEQPELEEQAKAEDAKDNGWIAWTRSPPRPIPALHGPLSLPYARCPSGAEGTIIDEQDNLPRMIWGLGTNHQQPSPVPTGVQDVQLPDHHITVGPPSNVDQSPARDLAKETPASPEKPQKASVYAHTQTPVSSRPDHTHRHTENHPPQHLDRRDMPYARHPTQDAIILEQLLSRSQESRPHVNEHSERPSVLPTPPSSSSPLWSSNFSPYQESLLSPLSNTYLGGQSPTIPQGSYHSPMDPSEQLRRLVHERLNDMGSSFNVASSLAPAAQISPITRSSQQPVDFNELSSPQAILNYLAKRDSHLSPSSVDLRSPSHHRNVSSISLQPVVKPRGHPSNSRSYVPPSPTSPEDHHHRPYSHHQPRSIPLARLIQRRLSAVQEEDASSTIRGRSPSPSLPSTDDRADPRYRRHAGLSPLDLREPSYRIGHQHSEDGRNFAQLQGQAAQVRNSPVGHFYHEDDLSAKVRLPAPPVQARYDSGGQSGRGRSVYDQRGRDGHDQERYGAQEAMKEGTGRGSGGRKKARGGRQRKAYSASTSVKG